MTAESEDGRKMLASPEGNIYNSADRTMSRKAVVSLPSASSIGLTLALIVLFFTAAGYVLDRWLNTEPWLMLAGGLVGAALGFARMVRTLMRAADQARGDMRRKSQKDP